MQMPCAIRDLTEHFADPKLVWSSRADLERCFDPETRRIRRGVYVLYFENSSDAPVYDKNRDYRLGGEGKLVIHAAGASLKPGRFQDGLIARRYQDADHLHRMRQERVGKTFQECIRLLLVLDLSAANVEVVNAAEGRLKACLDEGFLSGRLRSGADRRGDWRHLTRPECVDVVRRASVEALSRVAEQFRRE